MHGLMNQNIGPFRKIRQGREERRIGPEDNHLAAGIEFERVAFLNRRMRNPERGDTHMIIFKNRTFGKLLP
ncbi:MAG: Uncharacterised protein [SAR116 cluster bacterium MED-G04]|nr:MAG: Uncharacterised protein [SAR116 cluster bacterium MED-G04]